MPTEAKISYRANQWQNTEAGYGISVKNVV